MNVEDPGLPLVLAALELRRGSRPMCVNQQFVDVVTGATLGEVDIETQEAMIEYKDRSTYRSDFANQLRDNYHNPRVNLLSKQVVFYGPYLRDVGGLRRRALETAGGSNLVIVYNDAISRSEFAALIFP